jgi:hypothetical protein
MKRIALLFGSISGGIMVVMFFGVRIVIGDDADFSTGEWIGYATMIIALSMIFVGVKSFRDKSSNGMISFGKAFQVGLLITLVASAIYVFGWM